MKKRKLWIGTILSIILISPFHKKNHFYKNIKMVKNPANLDILVNKNNKLDKNYIPTDLELIDINYAYENKYLRKEAKEMFEKLSKDDFNKALLEIGLNETQSENLQKYFSLSLDQTNEMFKNSENDILNEGLKELNDLNDYLTVLNLQEYCKFTSSLARGQDYYTGTVFEVYEKNGKLNCSIGGGGRYDKIITDFIGDGNIYPAVGVSFGLTSLYEILKDRAEFSSKSLLDFYIIPMGTEKESLKLAIELRKQGYKVDISMNGRKLRKCLDYANKTNIPYVVILGEDEINNEKFVVKDMINKNQIEVSFNDIKNIKQLLK